VNRKTRKSALRGALTLHAKRGTLGVVDASVFSEPSTKTASEFAASWGVELPLVVVAEPEEEALVKSFRNLAGVVVVDPSELEVGTLVWAGSVLASETALKRVQEVMSR
jgi:large subunit ribosomal protein L4